VSPIRGDSGGRLKKMTYTQGDGIERWNRNAKSWHQFFGANDPSRRDLLDPIILQILGDVSGKRVLDAGCGEGYLSRKLAKLGAIVTGVELSQEMLSFALEKQNKNPLGITYHNADITSLPFLTDQSFDVVITNNVIQDVENYEGALQEFSRLLQSSGTYLQIINHPCFSTPGCGWVRDADGNRLYWKIDYYFKRGPFPIKWRTETGMEPTIFWHRTLGDSVNSLISKGFRITGLIEPEPPESWINLHPEMYKSDSRKPDFLVIVCNRDTRPDE
jgi:ubiquinone/menaquinone biosynthesis C-methylase UbiE